MIESLERFERARIAVIGDVMLDVYVEGSVERISPEAPVPVIHQVAERAVPGGAANVAANIASLGAAVTIVGLIGRDAAADMLRAALAAHAGIDQAHLVASEIRHTTTKTRLIGYHQQVARIDREDRDAISEPVEATLIDRAMEAIAAADLVVLSDYGKGVLTDAVLHAAIAEARRLNKLTIVDPKRRDFSVYRGATVITPNRAELERATGMACEDDDQVLAAAAAAQSATGAAILVTRSERGLTLVPRDGEAIHLRTVARQVFDVSGAGDTVVAGLATGLASGLPFVEAMKIANLAAGIVVAKAGTATVTRAELVAGLQFGTSAADIDDGRLVSWPELLRLRAAWRENGLTVGFANGCFDIVHPGHVALLRQAARHCDKLVVALNSDTSVRRLKGPTRPVQTEQARAHVIGSIKGVAAVVTFPQDTPYELISALKPDLLVKGSDYSEDRVVGADLVKASGGIVLLAELVEGQSTTALLSRANAPPTSEPQ
ncbi:D-glycero-beta-D-manno-heptose-7-phosphate kinase [Phreatobacter sp. AB_2022a]|uniref:D-glycero-beta-D-manno-heptose-7-phosphate kinase n=1 Tax=Phreatobacter sp. AB_2022a TaxID=3003134 RepID=UPI0022870344|nr:D-glycero-beta-D-manno-heptose-7-phosphate kinase [Phreatobacter sp. AB_2022a]MCZ0738383.1 D-glycero-beta-D-manno-heptose-7-phosphate kinase [Phreatobacter sp. AB_2022a]